MTYGNSENTALLISNGALEVLKNRLEDGTELVKNQAAWGVGNIAGEPQLRDICLEMGLMPLIVKLLESSSSQNSQRVAAWTISKLCCCPPWPPRDEVRICIPALVETLKQSTDELISVAICTALSYLSDCSGNDDTSVIEVFETGITPLLMQILRRTDNIEIIVPALKILGNFSSGSDDLVDDLLQHGIINDLPRFMNLAPTMQLAFWTASNLLGGTNEQCSMAMDLMPLILQFIVAPVDQPTLVESLFCLHSVLYERDPVLALDLLLPYQPQEAIIAFLSSFERHQSPSIYDSLREVLSSFMSRIFNQEQCEALLPYFENS